jgi:hypothetical protein
VRVIVSVVVLGTDAGSIGSENVTANVSPTAIVPSLFAVAMLVGAGFVLSYVNVADDVTEFPATSVDDTVTVYETPSFNFEDASATLHELPERVSGAFATVTLNAVPFQ